MSFMDGCYGTAYSLVEEWVVDCDPFLFHACASVCPLKLVGVVVSGVIGLSLLHFGLHRKGGVHDHPPIPVCLILGPVRVNGWIYILSMGGPWMDVHGHLWASSGGSLSVLFPDVHGRDWYVCYVRMSMVKWYCYFRVDFHGTGIPQTRS